MNPLVKFSIENFRSLIAELGRINKPEYLFDLEDKIIDEIATIMRNDEKDAARAKIMKIKRQIMEEIDSEPHVKPILRSFQNSIEGATSAALFCL
ncbi:MAG TPA: hypothetical protein VMD02_06560 [Candidatus Omnitrophota bacterium]|nr:hypothetical protein [Candidatus Omnitrophota bacterium]